MIPLKLKIKGIYSYQEEQEIDFTRLTEAGLFGIFGKVGAGKSAILDAMSYAIYEANDRLSVDAKYNMMNLKSKEMTIDFNFLAGREKRQFYIKVRATRNKNKFSDVNIKEHDFYEVKNDKVIPIESSEIISEIGVFYENFNRTIVIPQGKFQEFLSLKPTERTRMLQEIFSLDQYDLSAKTRILVDKNDKELTKTNTKLEGLEEVAIEYINKKKDEAKTHSVKKDDLQNKLGPEKKELLLLDQTAIDFEAYNKKNVELTDLAKKDSEYKKMQQDLNEFKKCKTDFKPLFDSHDSDKTLLENSIKTIYDINDRIEILNKQKDKAGEEYKTANDNKNKTPEMSKKADQLNAIISYLDGQSQIKKLQNTITKEAGIILEEDKKIKQEKLNRDKITNEIGKLMESTANLEYLSKVKNWFEKNESLTEKGDELKDQFSGLKKEFNNKKSNLDAFKKGAFKLLFKTLPADFEYDEFKFVVNKEKEILDKKYSNLEEEKHKLSVQQELIEHASKLIDGEPCLMCGSKSHPKPMTKMDLNKKLKDIKQQLEQQELLSEELGELNGDVKSVLKELKDIEKQRKAVEEKIEKTQKENDEHKKKFPKGNLKKEQYKEFKSEWNVLEKNQKLHQDKNDQRSKSDLTIGGLETDLEKRKNELKKNQREIDILSGQIQQQVGFFTLINIISYETISTIEIKTEEKKIRSEIESIEKIEKEIKKQIENLKEDASKLSGQINAMEKEKARLESSISDLDTRINVEIGQSEMSREQVREILKKNLEEKKIELEIAEYNKSLNQLRGQVKELEGKIKGKTLNEARRSELKLNIPLREEELEQIKNSLVIIVNEITSLEEKLKEKKVLLEEKKRLSERESNLKTFTSLFNSKGFVNFLSSKYLNNVVQIANQRFYKMTRQKYRLELKEDNSFMIRDLMNNGELRHIKSLSGGQTFQAALSLALALSENIQHSAGVDQQFFFLDEGFGSLDKESLQVVFDTLKSLRNERRVVGLISHVEELQQDIDVYLKIEEDPVTGSFIKNSWANN